MSCFEENCGSSDVESALGFANRLHTRCLVFCRTPKRDCVHCTKFFFDLEEQLLSTIQLLEQLRYQPAAHIRGGAAMLLYLFNEAFILADKTTKDVLSGQLHCIGVKSRLWSFICRKTIHQELENVLAQFRSLVPVLTATCMLVQRCEDDREEHSRAASAPQTPTAAIENRFANISAAAKCSSIAAMPLVTPPQQRLRRSSMPEIQLSQHQHLLSTARLFSTNACPHGLIAHVSDMHRLRNAIAQIKGLREIEPFWYNRTSNYKILQRILYAAHGAALHAMQFENEWAKLLVLGILCGFYFVAPGYARKQLMQVYQTDSFDEPNASPVSHTTNAPGCVSLVSGPTGGGEDSPKLTPVVPINPSSTVTQPILKLARAVFELHEIFFVQLAEKRVLYTHVRVNTSIEITGIIRRHHHPTPPACAYKGGGLHRCSCGAGCGGISYEVQYDGSPYVQEDEHDSASAMDVQKVSVTCRVVSVNALPATASNSAVVISTSSSPMSHVKRLRRHVQPDHEFKHPMQTFNWSLLSRAVALGLRAYDAVTGNLYSLTDVMRYGSTSETRKQPKLRRSSKAKDVPVVLHFHGGGWISMSSKSHQMYVRHWASATGAVVLSVDYSLSPSAVWPTALLQCYMAYKWVIDGGLGFVPTVVVLAGDSAGGNLAVSVALKALLENIRSPDGLLLFYPALYAYASPSPSRLLFANDPVIPRVFMEECLKAYLPSTANSARIAEDPFISPALAPNWLLSQLPPIRIDVGTIDPLMDDSVDFAHKLVGLDVDVQLHVHDGMPHGFLNLAALLPEARHVIHDSCGRLKELLELIRTSQL